MRMFCAGVALLTLALTAACGREPDVLARIGDSPITVDDFRETFSILPPAEQVEVLEPGGRLALLDRMITKRVLELALASEDTSGASFWVSLYEDEWLSRTWRESCYSTYRDSADADIAELSRQVRLRIVLMPDSTGAARQAASWSNPGYTPPAVTSLAPWSAGGSSYRVLGGPAFALPQELATTLLPLAGSGPAVFPLYDAWAAAELELGEASADSLPPGSAPLISFNNDLRRRSAVSPSSPGIEALASMMLQGPDGRYVLPDLEGREEAGIVLVRWAGGSIDAGQVSRLFGSVRPASFFGDIPPELQPVAAPKPGPAGPGVDLWFYLTGLAQQRWEASQARGAGLDPDTAQIATMASVEHLLRANVLEPVPIPDSSQVMAFYERNRGSFVLPERRSVLLAYLPSEKADSIGPVAGFEAVSSWAPSSPDGGPLPTPAQMPDAFGPLADTIFAAAPGAVSGPLATSAPDLSAYFEVVAVLPPDTASPGEIWSLLEAHARSERILEAYVAFVSELRSGFGVEIDSSAVEAVDPWSGTY